MTADSIINELKSVFELATTGFDAFYKEAEEKGKGYSSKAASSGDHSTAASSGFCSKAASSGFCSKAQSTGEYAACTVLGYRAAVSGGIGNLIMASEYAQKDGKYIPIGGKADLVDGKKLKANHWYIVENGEWVNVDFTDGIFTRVISSKSGVKKVKDDNGNILYIVTDGEKHAHGKTIAEARESLIYKLADRDTSKYEGMKTTATVTKAEAIQMYRAITGACEGGVRSFVESNKDHDKDKYKISELIKLTKGQYGAEQFEQFFKKGK